MREISVQVIGQCPCCWKLNNNGSAILRLQMSTKFILKYFNSRLSGQQCQTHWHAHYHGIFFSKWPEKCPLIHFKDEYNLYVTTPVSDELSQDKYCKHTCSSHHCKFYLTDTSIADSVTTLLSINSPFDCLKMQNYFDFLLMVYAF